jgi:hypothetical protein
VGPLPSKNPSIEGFFDLVYLIFKEESVCAVSLGQDKTENGASGGNPGNFAKGARGPLYFL